VEDDFFLNWTFLLETGINTHIATLNVKMSKLLSPNLVCQRGRGLKRCALGVNG